MIKVAIIEDNASYRQTLSIIMQLDESLQLIHKLPNCNDMLLRFTEEQPDVVIMDIDLPGISGIQGVWQLKQEWPEIKVLMLTMFEEEEKIFGALKAGANGYLLKKDSPQKIIESIHAVYKGESAMNGMIASKVLDYFYTQQKKTAATLDKTTLTEREKEVLQLIVKGYSYKEIAAQCFITVQTLNSHIKNIYQKLNVHSRAELAAKFREE
ncbi:MAG TPA: response regulator transcription factor [Panacibacter sp.]|nr:response regulator transcription factor [Panacibacter sp.]